MQSERFAVSELSDQLLQKLSQTFSAEMFLWRRMQDAWCLVPERRETALCDLDAIIPTSRILDSLSFSGESGSEIPAGIKNFLDEMLFKSSGEPGYSASFPIGSENCFVASTSLGDEGQFEIVGGVIAIDGLKLTDRLLESSVRSLQIDELQELQSQYAARLSSSFEELCFLRRLSSHIEFCVGNRSLSEVAQLVLGELRLIISVESICLIEAVSEPHSKLPKAGKMLIQEGAMPLNEDFWIDLLDGMGFQSDRAQVRNLHNSLYRNGFRGSQDVRSFALAPIRNDGKLYGWLLAVNKKVPHELTGVLLNSLGDDELGSMEASLLEVAARILGAQASNHQLFNSLEQLMVDVIKTLVNVVEAKDQYTSGHSNRVARIAHHLATQLNIPSHECTDIFTAGLLHDIGKIGVRDEVLNKPGKLTDDEFEEIKQHPVIGARMLEKMKDLEKYLPGVLYHHESFDGSGYPSGLKGQEIPMMARVLAVADALDAMTSNRPYRQGMPIEKAAGILQAGAGKQWDAAVVSAYLSIKESIDPICNTWKGVESSLKSQETPVSPICPFSSSMLVMPESTAISSS